MPKSRCSAEFIEDKLGAPICVGCDGFVPAGKVKASNGKGKRRMWAPIPIFETQATPASIRPSTPPLVVDRFNRKFGGNWKTQEAAARINRPIDEIFGHGFFDEM